METELTIQEVAKRTGISIDTLRYYERIGLLDPVRRDQSGYRRYSQQDLDWIGLLMALRKTGMPLAQMARLGQLRRQGFETTLTERRLLLEEYQRTLQEHLQELEQHLTLVQGKITHLKELEAVFNPPLPLASASVPNEAPEHQEGQETNQC
jgi:DNA-binding transcriptional MerR regulator